MPQKLEEARMREILERIRNQYIIISHPSKATPFVFPTMVDRQLEEWESWRVKI